MVVLDLARQGSQVLENFDSCLAKLACDGPIQRGPIGPACILSLINSDQTCFKFCL
uniref:Uncharacterized protein n=1 Tax=Arundo donax TaxID=35708 RepID=A0A0A9FP38_ARUDO